MLVVNVILLFFLYIPKSCPFRLERFHVVRTGRRCSSSIGIQLFATFTPTHEKMLNIIERVNDCNKISNARIDILTPFLINDVLFGYVESDFMAVLTDFPEVFQIINDGHSGKSILRFVDSLELGTFQHRTEAIAKMCLKLKELKLVKGWRDELVPVLSSFSSPAAFAIERGVYPYFGIKGYGVHLNGYTVDSFDKPDHLWVAKRSLMKSTWPGMLDHIVAGGIVHGLSPTENVIKECAEEANIPFHIAKDAISVGAVSYKGADERGRLKRDVLFCYDLKLSSDFIPTPVDGEVESFQLKDFSWILEKVANGGPEGYKPNCNLVVIDFMIRHGIISAESPYYLELLRSLRGAECT